MLWTALAVGGIATVLFLAFPGIDLWAARHFYLGPRDFAWNRPGMGPTVRWGFVLVFTATVVAAAAGLLLAAVTGRRLLGLGFPHWLFLVLCFALGPGLVANTLLKDHWGRARPRDVVELGGQKKFSPPVLPAKQCARNCAFVSGEASSMYMPGLAAAYVFPAWRVALIAFGVVGGLGAGLVRMGQGGHFLSDVIFAGVFMALTAVLLHWLVFGRLRELLADGGPLHARLRGSRGRDET